MAQKEYLKMADVFDGDMDGRQLSGWKHQGKYVPLKTIQQYAANAINSHDELVAEVERLRGAITSSRLALSNAAMNMKWFDISKAQEILREVNAIDKLISAIGTSDAKI